MSSTFFNPLMTLKIKIVDKTKCSRRAAELRSRECKSVESGCYIQFTHLNRSIFFLVVNGEFYKYYVFLADSRIFVRVWMWSGCGYKGRFLLNN
jgi:hypothetical protein